MIRKVGIITPTNFNHAFRLLRIFVPFPITRIELGGKKLINKAGKYIATNDQNHGFT